LPVARKSRISPRCIGRVSPRGELFPKVGDFTTLRTDATSLKGWWRNRVTRTLLVFMFSSIGAVIGAYVAGLRIFERLSS
jgi:pheromone shutdown protein TraB